jgi:hypothetical protein
MRVERHHVPWAALSDLRPSEKLEFGVTDLLIHEHEWWGGEGDGSGFVVN